MAEKQKVTIDLDQILLRRIAHIGVDWGFRRKHAIERLVELAVEQVKSNMPADVVEERTDGVELHQQL